MLLGFLLINMLLSCGLKSPIKDKISSFWMHVKGWIWKKIQFYYRKIATDSKNCVNIEYKLFMFLSFHFHYYYLFMWIYFFSFDLFFKLFQFFIHHEKSWTQWLIFNVYFYFFFFSAKFHKFLFFFFFGFTVNIYGVFITFFLVFLIYLVKML